VSAHYLCVRRRHAPQRGPGEGRRGRQLLVLLLLGQAHALQARRQARPELAAAPVAILPPRAAWRLRVTRGGRVRVRVWDELECLELDDTR